MAARKKKSAAARRGAAKGDVIGGKIKRDVNARAFVRDLASGKLKPGKPSTRAAYLSAEATKGERQVAKGRRVLKGTKKKKK